jgi:hypothetical protein
VFIVVVFFLFFVVVVVDDVVIVVFVSIKNIFCKKSIRVFRELFSRVI